VSFEQGISILFADNDDDDDDDDDCELTAVGAQEHRFKEAK